METTSQIDPAIQARENYIRNIDPSGIRNLPEFNRIAEGLAHISPYSFALVRVLLPEMRAIGADTIDRYVNSEAWLHLEYMFLSVTTRGKLGNRFYRGREIHISHALLEQHSAAAALSAIDHRAMEADRIAKERAYAEQARHFISQERPHEAIPLPPLEILRRQLLEQIPPPSEMVRRQLLEQIPQPVLKTNPAPLWWEVENMAREIKKEEVIALRNDLRKLLGGHNPT